MSLKPAEWLAKHAAQHAAEHTAIHDTHYPVPHNAADDATLLSADIEPHGPTFCPSK